MQHMRLEQEKLQSLRNRLQRELDTSGVEPLSHVFPVHNVFREDEVNEHDGRENTLANAPERNGDSFVVPKTILGD